MCKVIATLVLLSVCGWVAPSFAQVTQAQCDHDYDACKKTHIFDKKPCRKRRDNCFAQLNAQNEQQKKTDTKNRMMSGQVQQQPGNSMRDRAIGNYGSASMQPIDPKTAAQMRLKAREANAAPTPGGEGMRKNVQNH